MQRTAKTSSLRLRESGPGDRAGERVAAGSPGRSRRVATAPTVHPGTILQGMGRILCHLGLHSRRYHLYGWHCRRCPEFTLVLP